MKENGTSEFSSDDVQVMVADGSCRAILMEGISSPVATLRQASKQQRNSYQMHGISNVEQLNNNSIALYDDELSKLLRVRV